MLGKKQWLETYMELRTGSKLGKEYNKDIYCHPVYVTYFQSTSSNQSLLKEINPEYSLDSCFFKNNSVSKESACNAGDLGSIPGWGNSLEKEMATHPSILAWRIPWTEEPGGLQSMGSQELDTS